MPNKNYINGRAKEYRLAKKYRKEGNIVIRASGSHGFCDLVVINQKNKTIAFIQVKPRNFSENMRNKLLEESAWLFDEFTCEFSVE
jgi:Holliday junction resolvase